MIPRHRIDAGLDDLLFAARMCVTQPVLPIEWEGALVCQSVRSAFDLYLSAVALPRGSEVLVTALTIPDMVRILEDHGLVAVPVDLDPATLAPRPEWIAAARTPRTRAVLFAHLLGARMEMPACDGLLVIEDAAQAFVGPAWRGSATADVTLFSFGSIKTATALGGALAYVKSSAVRSAMARLQAAWPVQPVAHYARKVAKTIALHTVRDPRGYGALAVGCSLAGTSLEAVLNHVTKGFPDPAAMLAGIRRQPCGALVAMLRRRLERFTDKRVQRRAAAGNALAIALRDRVTVLGSEQTDRTHWLFAVLVDEPLPVIERLSAQGFDATRGATSLAAVHAPPGRAEPARVMRLLERIVFLPAWPEIPEAERERMANAVVVTQSALGLAPLGA